MLEAYIAKNFDLAGRKSLSIILRFVETTSTVQGAPNGYKPELFRRQCGCRARLRPSPTPQPYAYTHILCVCVFTTVEGVCCVPIFVMGNHAAMGIEKNER